MLPGVRNWGNRRAEDWLYFVGTVHFQHSTGNFAFRQAYPDVHLTLTEITSQEVAAGLEDKTIQVGIMRPLALPDSLVVFELLNEPLVAIMRADHPLAAESENGIYMSALAAEPFVFFPRTYGSGIYAQVLSLARRGFQPADHSGSG